MENDSICRVNTQFSITYCWQN